MMKKQLYILYLLLLSVQLAIAQTTRYEYWLDNDHDGRTVVANNVTDVTLDLDISAMKPGLHYFNFRAQGDSAQWGGLSRYLFYIRDVVDPTVSSMTQYEYWLDNQHEVRTAVKGSTSEVPLNLDISSLKPGLHYFNFRAQGKSGQWGGLSRYLFYIRDNVDITTSSMTQYEYWLDNNYSGRTVVNGATEDIPLNVDISQLKPGLHYFNFRAQGKSGQWGGLSRYLFYIREEADTTAASMTQYEYWLDKNYDERTIVKGNATDIPLNLDISGLKPGLHYFNVRAQGKSGQWGGLSRYLFYLREGSIQQQQLANIEYWIDERQDVMIQQVTDSTVVIMVDISKMMSGTHTFYMEGVASNGSRGTLNAYEFNVESVDPEPYAVLSSDSLTVTFYYDGQKSARGGIDINNRVVYGSNANPQYGTATAAVIDPSFADYRPTSTANWFQNCFVLASITGMENLKTDNVTDMSSMFFRCDSLKSLDVSHFNTEKVWNMHGMFTGCGSLTSLDVRNFRTDYVTDMSWMFDGCSGLTELYLLELNTFGVRDMSYMFSGCTGLKYLILTFLTDNVTNMSNMFSHCYSMTSLVMTSFKTANVKNMSEMFTGCSNLAELDLRDFNTANVTDMSNMFEYCYNLKTIFVGSEWSTAAVTNSENMFYCCYNLFGGKGTMYDWIHNDHTYARIDEGPDNPGYFTRSGDEPYVPVYYSFDSNGVLIVWNSTTLADALTAAGGRDEVAKRITAIEWYSTATLTDSDLQGLDNPNMLIYVQNESQALQNRNNVVVRHEMVDEAGNYIYDEVGNVRVQWSAKNVVLADAKEGNNNFYCPQEFTAEMVSYTRDFQQQTQVGVSRGWESIALPFNVQTITHEKQGVIAPFGSSASGKHFWLRRLGDNGLMQATKMEANVPYIISMPNNPEYSSDYNLPGMVTFSAENVTIPVTEPVTLAKADSTIKMVPAFQSVGRSSNVWALNVGQSRGEYYEGSVFERDYREVRPFEAYTVHQSDSPAPRFVPIMDIGGATGIEDVRSLMSDGRGDNLYDLNGRKLQQKPTQKGIYILNGRKTVIK